MPLDLSIRLLSALARLPRPRHRELLVEKDLAVPMDDGVTLLADRVAPIDLPAAPILLARTPYGNREPMRPLRLIAAQGFQVVSVRCRGTFGSGGEFDPFFAEAADGRATLRWLREQPWYSGQVCLFGPSYLGLTQWAVLHSGGGGAEEVSEVGDVGDVKGAAISVSASDFPRDLIYPGGAFALDLATTWLYALDVQERSWLTRRRAQLTRKRHKVAAVAALPVPDADRPLVGHRIGYYRDWTAHEDVTDEYWRRIDFRPVPAATAETRTPPVNLVAGWYDIMLTGQLTDHVLLTERALRLGGTPPRLTVGPWHHASPGAALTVLRELVGHAGQVFGTGTGFPPAVRVRVLGAPRRTGWVTLPSWPPEPTGQLRLSATATGVLTSTPDTPADSAVPAIGSFVHDPADPAPMAGGRSLDPALAGPKDQAPRENRDDVLVFSTEPLAEPVTVIGVPTVRLRLRLSNPNADLFVRLCDVAPGRGGRERSVNITDAGLRLDPRLDAARDRAVASSAGAPAAELRRLPDDTVEVTLPLAPTACRFAAGHRIRVQISGAANALLARNTGSGEPLSTATALISTRYEVFAPDGAAPVLELPLQDPTPQDPTPPDPTLPDSGQPR